MLQSIQEQFNCCVASSGGDHCGCSQGNDSFFLALSFSSLLAPLPPPSCPFCLAIFFFSSAAAVSSNCFSPPQLPSVHVRLCGKNPALGLHCLFHVRTSGDIKGLQRGLSLCISPALSNRARGSQHLPASATHSLPVSNIS